uniref:SOGA 1/2-like coiled-coil domain-containing protein n=1 Tax=Oncorhynchus tshawytscha TaxID=74940 RepID=A0AAZ3PW86_ONCTS
HSLPPNSLACHLSLPASLSTPPYPSPSLSACLSLYSSFSISLSACLSLSTPPSPSPSLPASLSTPLSPSPSLPACLPLSLLLLLHLPLHLSLPVQLEARGGPVVELGLRTQSPEPRESPLQRGDREQQRRLLVDTHTAAMDLRCRLELSEKGWVREKSELMERFNSERKEWESQLGDMQRKIEEMYKEVKVRHEVSGEMREPVGEITEEVTLNVSVHTTSTGSSMLSDNSTSDPQNSSSSQSEPTNQRGSYPVVTATTTSPPTETGRITVATEETPVTMTTVSVTRKWTWRNWRPSCEGLTETLPLKGVWLMSVAPPTVDLV